MGVVKGRLIGKGSVAFDVEQSQLFADFHLSHQGFDIKAGQDLRQNGRLIQKTGGAVVQLRFRGRGNLFFGRRDQGK